MIDIEEEFTEIGRITFSIIYLISLLWVVLINRFKHLVPAHEKVMSRYSEEPTTRNKQPHDTDLDLNSNENF